MSVEALRDRLLAACNAGEISARSCQNVDAMETEASVVQENKELGLLTIVVPRFKLRLTVSSYPKSYQRVE